MQPVLQALVLADRVYEDQSGKKIIAGTFNRIKLNRKGRIPTESHPTDSAKQVFRSPVIDTGTPFVYLSLTDVLPEIDVTLQFVNVSTNKVLLETGIKIKCPDRLATVEIALPLLPLTMLVHEPGTYSLDLVYAGEIVGSHRVIAEDVTDQP